MSRQDERVRLRAEVEALRTGIHRVAHATKDAATRTALHELLAADPSRSDEDGGHLIIMTL